MRACLVSGRFATLGDECAERDRVLDLLALRAVDRVEALAFDLDFVMGSSDVWRRHPPHHLSPARENPGRAYPKRAFPVQVIYSNAPIKPPSQSNLSKIIALWLALRPQHA